MYNTMNEIDQGIKELVDSCETIRERKIVALICFAGPYIGLAILVGLSLIL